MISICIFAIFLNTTQQQSVQSGAVILSIIFNVSKIISFPSLLAAEYRVSVSAKALNNGKTL